MNVDALWKLNLRLLVCIGIIDGFCIICATVLGAIWQSYWRFIFFSSFLLRPSNIFYWMILRNVAFVTYADYRDNLCFVLERKA